MQAAEWRYSPSHNTSSIVLIGNFNPIIFQPRWMRSVEIISKDEVDEILDKGVEVIHQELVRFKTSWMILQAETGRLGIQFVEEPFVRALDLAVSMFTYLIHTPIRQFGINRRVEFSFRTAEGWHAFGDRLAPKKDWSVLFESEATTRTGGLASLTMRRTSRPDEERGHLSVTLSATAERVCVVETNDHFDVSSEETHGAKPALDALQKHWNEAQERADKIVKSIMEIAHSEDS